MSARRRPEIPGPHFLCVVLTDAFWDAANRILHPYRAGIRSCERASTATNLRVILRFISLSLSFTMAPAPREEDARRAAPVCTSHLITTFLNATYQFLISTLGVKLFRVIIITRRRRTVRDVTVRRHPHVCKT